VLAECARFAVTTSVPLPTVAPNAARALQPGASHEAGCRIHSLVKAQTAASETFGAYDPVPVSGSSSRRRIIPGITVSPTAPASCRSSRSQSRTLGTNHPPWLPRWGCPLSACLDRADWLKHSSGVALRPQFAPRSRRAGIPPWRQRRAPAFSGPGSFQIPSLGRQYTEPPCCTQSRPAGVSLARDPWGRPRPRRYPMNPCSPPFSELSTQHSALASSTACRASPPTLPLPGLNLY
jgi:hypothetical protein